MAGRRRSPARRARHPPSITVRSTGAHRISPRTTTSPDAMPSRTALDLRQVLGVRDHPEAVTEDRVDDLVGDVVGRHPGDLGHECERTAVLGAPAAGGCCSLSVRSSSGRGTAPRRRSERRAHGDRDGDTPRSPPLPTSPPRTSPCRGTTISPPTDEVLTTCAGSAVVDHPRDECFDAVDHAPQVDAEQPLPLAELELPGRPRQLDAGVVAEEMDRRRIPLRRASRAAGRPPSARRRPRSRARRAGRPTCRGSLLEPARVDVGHHDPHVLGRRAAAPERGRCHWLLR